MRKHSRDRVFDKLRQPAVSIASRKTRAPQQTGYRSRAKFEGP